MTSDELVQRLGLVPHPEGGFYKETYRAQRQVDTPRGRRPAGTAIYYLLTRGTFSAWHRVIGSDEVWHFHAGDALVLHLLDENGRLETNVLGPDVAAGERPQVLVPASVLQAAEPRGAYTLVGCTVAPGFDYADFELPSADALVARYAQHAGILRRLATRGGGAPER